MCFKHCWQHLSYLALVAAVVAGCHDAGLALVPVEGRVTLNGEPLADADVVFRPQMGRPSLGKTDADGRYTLRYTMERMGAVPGKHKVSISTAEEADPDASDPQQKAGSRERVPAKYNSRTTLAVEVDAGRKGSVDFVLESAGANQPGRP